MNEEAKVRIFKVFDDMYVGVVEDDFGVFYYREFLTQEEAVKAANAYMVDGEGESQLEEHDAVDAVEGLEMLKSVIELTA